MKRSESTKLLGLTIDDKQNWKEEISGANGLVNALNHRIFTIRRITNQIPKKDVIKIVQSLWMSKLRYSTVKLEQRVMTQSTKMSKQSKSLKTKCSEC